MTGITTLTQKEEFKNCLDVLKDALFEKDLVFEKTLENKVQLPYSGIIKARMSEHNVTFAEKAKLKELITKLIKELSKLRTIGLTIAFEPQESSLSKIYAWSNNNLDDNSVLDIKVDPNVIGGAILNIRGHYVDNSLKRKLKQISADNLIKQSYGQL
jgi:F0F1-type ATP synthase delta subunit